MKVKKLNFKKEIVAVLSDTESNQMRGGSTTITTTSVASCFCYEYYSSDTNTNTSCCPTYSDCKCVYTAWNACV